MKLYNVYIRVDSFPLINIKGSVYAKDYESAKKKAVKFIKANVENYRDSMLEYVKIEEIQEGLRIE